MPDTKANTTPLARLLRATSRMKGIFGSIRLAMSDFTHDMPQQMAAAQASQSSWAGLWLRRIGGNASFRIVLWLAQRHIAARAISGLAIILSTFLFLPADFAAFGIMLAVLNVAGLLVFLRYDALLISAPTHAEFERAICLNLSLLGVSLAVIGVIASIGVALGYIPFIYVALFVVALCMRSLQRILGGIITRDGSFELIGQISLIHAITLPVTITVGYWLGVNGTVTMITSDIIANIVAIAFLYLRTGHTVRAALATRNHFNDMIALARDWSVLPRVNLPAAVMAMGFTQLPLIIIISIASDDIAGHVALLFRLMDFPVQMIMAASAPVLMNRLSKGSVHWLNMPKAILALGCVVAFIYASIVVGSFLIEPLLKTTAWAGVTQTVLLVALFQGAVAFSGPLIEACALYRNQNLLMAIHALMLVVVCLVFAYTPNWQTALTLVGIASLIRAALVSSRLSMLSLRDLG